MYQGFAGIPVKSGYAGNTKSGNNKGNSNQGHFSEHPAQVGQLQFMGIDIDRSDHHKKTGFKKCMVDYVVDCTGKPHPPLNAQESGQTQAGGDVANLTDTAVGKDPLHVSLQQGHRCPGQHGNNADPHQNVADYK